MNDQEMKNDRKEKDRTNRELRPTALALYIVSIIALFIGGLLVVNEVYIKNEVPDNFYNENLENTLKGDEVYQLEASKPTRVSVPGVGINSAIIELGLQESGEIEVPENFTDVGWYRFSPTPGELGPAVIIGHVDSYEGPAVFWELRNMKEGDIIEVEREDGTTAKFAVIGIEEYKQSNFPTSKVYGDIDYAGLRLITCTGTYNRETNRYSHNLVIYASLVDPNSEEDRQL